MDIRFDQFRNALVTDDGEAYEALSLLNIRLDTKTDNTTLDTLPLRFLVRKSDSAETDTLVDLKPGGRDFVWNWARENGYYTKADGSYAVVMDIVVGDTFSGSVGVIRAAIDFREENIKCDAIDLGALPAELEDGYGELEIVDLRLHGPSGSLVDEVSGEVLRRTQTDDLIEANDDARAYIFAGDGDDTVIGGAQDDWIKGSGGNEEVSGGDGADTFVVGVGMVSDTILD